MSEHLAFQRAIVDKAETLLHVLAAEILVDAVRWRVGIFVGEQGPTVGATSAADITYDPAEIVVVLPLVIDDALLVADRHAMETDGVDGDAPIDPWTWLRAAASGDIDTPEGRRIVQILDPSFKRDDGLDCLDEVVAKIIEFWTRRDDGSARIARWARDRETERRTTGRRLEGLRRRYDRDLLALADRIAIGSKK